MVAASIICSTLPGRLETNNNMLCFDKKWKKIIIDICKIYYSLHSYLFITRRDDPLCLIPFNQIVSTF